MRQSPLGGSWGWDKMTKIHTHTHTNLDCFVYMKLHTHIYCLGLFINFLGLLTMTRSNYSWMTRIVVIDNWDRYFGSEGILSFFFLCHGHGPVIKLSLRYPRKKDRKNGMRLLSFRPWWIFFKDNCVSFILRSTVKQNSCGEEDLHEIQPIPLRVS